MNLLSILTEHTCGEACWHAKEEVCRCSCGGRNHGILNTPNGQAPVRSCRIQGHVYQLAAVGKYYELAEQAEEINNQAGYRTVEEPMLAIEGHGQDKANSTMEAAAKAGEAGLRVRWIQYHYPWNMRDDGVPARVRECNPSQLKGWSELAPYREEGSGRPALLWVLETMPERPSVLMVDPETGLPLPEERQIPGWDRKQRKAAEKLRDLYQSQGMDAHLEYSGEQYTVVTDGTV